MASSSPSILYRKYKDACDVYEYFQKKLFNNQLTVGDVYSYLDQYEGVVNLPVLDVIGSLLATKGLGVIQQPEPIYGAQNQWIVVSSVNAPYPDYELHYLAWKDMVNLYLECVKIFSSKIFPPYNGQRIAFQDKYHYGFNANYSECDAIIVQLSQHYSDTGLVCVDFTDYYKVN